MKARNYLIAGGVVCLLLVVYFLMRIDEADRHDAKPSTVDVQAKVAEQIRPAASRPAAPIIRTTAPAPGSEAATPISKPNEIVWERSFGDYAVCCSTTAGDGEVLLEIRKKGRVVFSAKDYQFAVETQPDIDDPDWKTLPAIGSDITGSGQSNLVIAAFSGGNHCCHTYYVFAVGDEFQQVAILENAGAGTFVDLDKSDILNFKTFDDSYDQLDVPMSEMPQLPIILRFKDGQYVLAGDLMEAPAPAREVLEQHAALFKDEFQKLGQEDDGLRQSTRAKLWREMLDLTYTGHETLARDLFDKSWPDGLPGKQEALDRFANVVADSPYWQELVKWQDIKTSP